ncbi:biotin--[acetyl-CoA-carboxylase] ligase [Humibacter ginsenosidimutans]|uniref:biotin--[biotin carboxyl-carrier protein] ligase n=1 Tax=Humibacter ginsenosidimutans TaxID=2599293 RepID=A0A5B8M6S3_9MICO|nr:biotin--[acetyl-CoA-carboxylase] ligase [Humibacter ginsenosidimutans]QDZ16408.1 biotin--[acetyl-CoA-carboxylase] ligase [Humibacter ginsenosidimutans]
MDLRRANASASKLEWRERSTSTNDELAALVRSEPSSAWPEFSVLATDVQTAGRGRLGRVWTAPDGTMLAVSVLLRPTSAGIRSADALGWLPLLAGLAMSRALRILGATTELKWPNDVLIAGRKVCGILCEVVDDDAVIVGSGVNLTLSSTDLPVPTATSLLLEGAAHDADAVLAAYLSELRSLYEAFGAASGDAVVGGIKDAVSADCSTLGKSVRVELPGADTLSGVARSLDDDGRLVVDVDGRLTAVAAGDVTHLRY